MNKVILDNPGGFPFEQDTLKFMQNAHADLINYLGALAGDDKIIIAGCELTGNTVSNGLVYISGELLPFRGGTAGQHVVVIEEAQEMTYADGVSRPTYITRYATFGSGAVQYNWSDFRRQYLSSSVIVGEIRMFAGNVNNLPAGWYVCDGTNGTPDLRGRFIVGHDPADFDYRFVGLHGGAKQITLTEDEMPSHTHTGNMSSEGGHTPTGTAAGPYVGSNIGGGFAGGNNDFKNRPVNMDYVPDHTHTLNINNTGGGQPHENRPPYFVLMFIQFKGF